MALKVLIKPVNRQSFQGRHKQDTKLVRGKIITTKTMDKTKASGPAGISCSDEYKPKIDYTKRKYIMGLNEKVTNPWFAENPSEEAINEVRFQYDLSQKWDAQNRLKTLVGSKQISLQNLLEIKNGSDPGYFDMSIPRMDRGVADMSDPSFLQTFSVELEGNMTHILNTDNVFDFLKYQLIKNRPDKIAPSINDVNPSAHDWYISQEFEEDRAVQAKNRAENEAIKVLFELEEKYSLKERYMIASQLVGEDNRYIVNGVVSEFYLDKALNDFIKLQGRDKQNRIKSFMEVHGNFIKNNKKFYIDYLIAQGFSSYVFEKQNGFVWWRSQKDSPSLWKFDTTEALSRKIYSEYEMYDPAERTGLVYEKLINELKSHHVPHLILDQGEEPVTRKRSTKKK